MLDSSVPKNLEPRLNQGLGVLLDQFVSSKNELKLMQTIGSFCSVSNSNSVNGGNKSKYWGLRDFLVNVPISIRWHCKVAIFSD